MEGWSIPERKFRENGKGDITKDRWETSLRTEEHNLLGLCRHTGSHQSEDTFYAF